MLNSNAEDAFTGIPHYSLHKSNSSYKKHRKHTYTLVEKRPDCDWGW